MSAYVDIVVLGVGALLLAFFLYRVALWVCK